MLVQNKKQTAPLNPFCLVEVTNSQGRYTTMTVKGHYPAWNESCQVPYHLKSESVTHPSLPTHDPISLTRSLTFALIYIPWPLSSLSINLQSENG